MEEQSQLAQGAEHLLLPHVERNAAQPSEGTVNGLKGQL